MRVFLSVEGAEAGSVDVAAAMRGALRHLDLSGGASSSPRAGLVYEIGSEKLKIIGSDLVAVAAAGLVPSEVDPEGLAGVLWRGAPMDARLPRTGFRARRADAPAAAAEGDLASALRTAASVAGDATVLLSGSLASAALLRVTGRPFLVVRWPHADGAAVLAWAKAAGASGRVVDGTPADPAGALEAYLRTMDLPSADGFERHLLHGAVTAAGVERVLDGTGGAALFGDGELFGAMAAPASEPAGRGPRGPSGDPLDLEGQRAFEAETLRRVPAHRAHAVQGFLPAATREALASLPARPPDGVIPAATSGPVLASDLRLAAALDAGDRDADAQSRRADVVSRRPFLDAGFVARARATPAAERFGIPGWGGWLRTTAGEPPPPAAVSFAPTLDAWMRGPLAGWVDATLSRDRLAAQGFWKANAVLEAVRRFRSRTHGWTARHVLLLGVLVRWVERERAAGKAP